jgi:hypothetical protein
MLNIILFLLGSWGIVGFLISIYYIVSGKSNSFLQSEPFFITWLIKLGLISNNTISFA